MRPSPAMLRRWRRAGSPGTRLPRPQRDLDLRQRRCLGVERESPLRAPAVAAPFEDEALRESRETPPGVGRPQPESGRDVIPHPQREPRSLPALVAALTVPERDHRELISVRDPLSPGLRDRDSERLPFLG
jgi:hypothetical protein